MNIIINSRVSENWFLLCVLNFNAGNALEAQSLNHFTGVAINGNDVLVDGGSL